MSHLKRLAMPKTWDIARKQTKFISRPLPGGVPMRLAMPLQVVLRDLLKLARTSREVRYILNHKEILVNGKKQKELKFPVAMMDVLEIPDIKKAYRLLMSSRGVLALVEIKGAEAKHRPCKIARKTVVKGGRLQLNFSDGTNLLADQKDYSTGDTLVMEIASGKVLEHISFEKKCLVYLIAGSHVGQTGTLEEIKGNSIVVKTPQRTVETLKDYAFVIGKQKPVIAMAE